MPGKPSTPTEAGVLARMRRFARRLERDERGLASMEFILAAPIILLIVLFVKHGNQLMTKKVDTVTQIRNAAFAEANGMECTSDMTRMFPDFVPALPISVARLTGKDAIACSSERSDKAKGDPRRTFVWDDLKREGADASSDIARDLRKEEPMLVTAEAARIYRFGARENLTPFRWDDSFTVGDATLFSSASAPSKYGYDKVLRDEIRDAAPKAGDLYDGIFKGADK